ncbi:MAG: Panacea domain-containing protein [Planctomycetota bacterium]|nr:Panacea domain-containing protein [Planctomycetota bacterium]
MVSGRIRFQFDLPKALQAMAFVVHHRGAVEKVKLIKLLYIADRNHFLAAGHPITGDDQYAMKFGPVPSSCLKVLDGESPVGEREVVFDHMHVIDNSVTLKQPLMIDRLSLSERRVLSQTIADHGHKWRWDLVEETHQFPEYRETYVEGTSTLIPYEVILKHYAGGDENKWRLNRPVVSTEMASRMNAPFRASEPDL